MPPNKSWEERFDSKFDHFNQQHSSKQICDPDCENDYGLEDIKSFITSLLKEVREEERAALKKKVEGMRKKLPKLSLTDESENIADREGVRIYNQALDDIIRLISK